MTDPRHAKFHFPSVLCVSGSGHDQRDSGLACLGSILQAFAAAVVSGFYGLMKVRHLGSRSLHVADPSLTRVKHTDD